MSQFYVKVKPDQDAFRIDMDGTYPLIELESPAEQGRANAEMEARLSERLGEDVAIVSGHRSRRKKIAVDLEKEEALSRLA